MSLNEARAQQALNTNLGYCRGESHLRAEFPGEEQLPGHSNEPGAGDPEQHASLK